MPRQAEASADSLEHKAIKGLRPFGLTDAEVFARLQREMPLREYLATVTGPEFRFGILCGESGCGKILPSSGRSLAEAAQARLPMRLRQVHRARPAGVHPSRTCGKMPAALGPVGKIDLLGHR